MKILWFLFDYKDAAGCDCHQAFGTLSLNGSVRAAAVNLKFYVEQQGCRVTGIQYAPRAQSPGDVERARMNELVPVYLSGEVIAEVLRDTKGTS